MALAQYPWQEALARELNGLRVAMPNAILLYGPRGIGTFELAHVYAKSLLCTAPQVDGTPCGVCKGCRLAAAMSHPDLRYLVSEAEALHREIPFVEPETATSTRKNLYREILIHQPRALADFLTLKSHEGGFRVVLVYPADRIRAEAAASLLKSIEEPPEKTVFILVADEIDRVLATIRSRCRLIRALPPTREVALSWLSEQGVADAERRLCAAGGMPLAVFEVDERLLLEEASQECLVALLMKGPGADANDVAAAIDRTLPLPATARFLSRWAWDIAALKVGAPARYFPREIEGLRGTIEKASAEKLYAWINSVRDVQAVSSHPLNAKIVLEALVLAYIRALVSF